MATENRILDLSFPAHEDLTDAQFQFVVLTTNGTVRKHTSASEVSLGVLQNAPEQGHAAVVRVSGVSKIVMAEGVNPGTFIRPNSAGKGIDAAASLQYARGILLEDSGANNDIASAYLLGPVPAITQTAWQRTTVTSINANENVTYTAAQLLGELILRDCNGANRSDATDTASNIVAAIAGCEVGSSFEFTIRNTSSASNTITLTAGTGVTLSGTMTIAQNNSRRFRAVVTNVTSPAVTIYSIMGGAH